jgi:starch phosphorylase
MEAVGMDNFFLFGLTVEGIQDLQQKGYQPYSLYQNDGDIREVFRSYSVRRFFPAETKMLFRPLLDSF